MITILSLLEELIARDRMAVFPSPSFQFKVALSHDPRQRSPEEVEDWKLYADNLSAMGGWFANRDFSQFIRTESHDNRTEYVMLDSAVPGVITWMWTGLPIPNVPNPGIIRFYFDGHDQPDVDMSIERFLNQGLCGPPLSAVCELGRNLFLPICWGKSCKITYDRGFWDTNPKDDKNRLWYIIYYREYPPETEVQTFNSVDLIALQERISFINRVLVNPSLYMIPDERLVKISDIEINPQQSAKLFTITNPCAISEINLKLNSKSEKIDDLRHIIRQCVIQITFDNIPSVVTPLGDFFGIGLGLRPCNNYYRQMTEDLNGTSRWIMPFQRTCQCSLSNLSNEKIKITEIQYKTIPWNWNDRSLYFHSSWHQRIHVPTRPFSDFNFLHLNGSGVFVGDCFTIYNASGFWWGEGNAKVKVDGEQQFHSTGTEDYYGYSYGDLGKYINHPFLTLTASRGNKLPGYACMGRTRALDRVPFQKSLQFDTEIWHWRDTWMDLAVSCQWYARIPEAQSINKNEIRMSLKKEPISLKERLKHCLYRR